MASTWTSSYRPKKYPKLDRNIEADAVIIGGGIAGTTAAYLLSKKGRKTVLIEKNKLADTNSAYTTAFLTNVVDTGLAEMSEMFGRETARNVWKSHAEAIDMIEKIIADEEIDCEFMRCDNYMYANDAGEWGGVREEARFAGQFGFDVEEKRTSDLPVRNAGFIVIKNQAKFHPLKYLDALRQKAAGAGALIFEETEAKDISCAPSSTGCVYTESGMIWAEKIMIATHDPFNKPKEIFAHKGIYSTYIHRNEHSIRKACRRHIRR